MPLPSSRPGRAVARPFSIPATRRSLATLFPLAPPSHPHLSSSRTRQRTSKRQFDKMQISFVSLTTIGFSASSSFSISFTPFSFSSSFLRPFPTSPSFGQQCSVPPPAIGPPHLTLLALPSFPFSLSATSFFYLLLFNRRSLVCPYQILRAISAGVYHLPRKTKVVKMNSLANFNLYLVDLI